MEAATDDLPTLLGEEAPVASRVVASSSDIALVVDDEGVIEDVWVGASLRPQASWSTLVGKRWTDTVLRDSKRKVEQLLKDAFAGHTTKPREVNLRVDDGGEFPIRFSGARIDDRRVILPGSDLRPLAELQQRLVSAQQAMDVEYRRLRQADTRYRVLFHVCSEGVLVVRGDDRTVVEANPAAATLLGKPVESLQGKALHSLFATGSRDRLSSFLGAIEAGADTTAELDPREADTVLSVSASTFRQSGSVLLLIRLWPTGAPRAADARDARLMRALEVLPDGFVVTTEDLRILNANPSFCELVQRTDEAQVIGRGLDDWLGRPGVDLNIIVANLREHGVVRDFSTIIRGDFGSEQEAIVTAVSAPDGDGQSFGFTIRPVSSRVAEPPSSTFLPRSVEQLRGLVGRVSLKEIVKESADLIERLCIEAALDVSSNNRAAAAQLLGLSRQSLYSKLRRHSIGEPSPTS
ncbi:MAG: transcriptional regulator PpsR [Myxococcota bacterium]